MHIRLPVRKHMRLTSSIRHLDTGCISLVLLGRRFHIRVPPFRSKHAQHEPSVNDDGDEAVGDLAGEGVGRAIAVIGVAVVGYHESERDDFAYEEPGRYQSEEESRDLAGMLVMRNGLGCKNRDDLPCWVWSSCGSRRTISWPRQSLSELRARGG